MKTGYKNPYDALVGFINKHNISPKEEMEVLRPIIKEIVEYEKPKWASVTDRFPEKGQKVLINQDVNKILCALFKGNGFFYYDIHTEDLEPVEAVTHWMPLPEKP
jgi:hypothetical protein